MHTITPSSSDAEILVDTSHRSKTTGRAGLARILASLLALAAFVTITLGADADRVDAAAATGTVGICFSWSQNGQAYPYNEEVFVQTWVPEWATTYTYPNEFRPAPTSRTSSCMTFTLPAGRWYRFWAITDVTPTFDPYRKVVKQATSKWVWVDPGREYQLGTLYISM